MRFKRPTLAQVQTVFGGIELFCSQLIAGEVYSTEDGTVLYKVREIVRSLEIGWRIRGEI